MFNWFSWSTLLASSTPDIGVLANFLFPLIVISFVATAAIVGIKFVVGLVHWMMGKLDPEYAWKHRNDNKTQDEIDYWRSKGL